MPEADVNGIRLYYEEHGSGAAVLCIHGAGSSALVWADAVEKLARVGRVVAYDRRGCSRSERPAPYERTSIGEHADDAAALLDVVAAAPAVVVGRSYGGTVAIDLALRYPDRSGRWCCWSRMRPASSHQRQPSGWMRSLTGFARWRHGTASMPSPRR